MEGEPTTEVPRAAPLPVLVNGRAGLGKADPSGPVARALRDAGVAAEVSRIPPERLGAEVARRARGGAPVLGVAGGDGTLLAAAEALAGAESVLALIPTGTLNHFARRLGMETIGAAAEAIARGGVSRQPLGVVDDHVFLNTATFGVYADIVRRRERLRPRLRKWGAAVVAFLSAALRMRPMELSLVVEGELLSRRTPLVWVGMGRGSFPLVHEAPERREEPDLEIVVLRPGGRFGALALLLRLLVLLRQRERPVRDPALEILHARHLLIRAEGRIGVTLDGEVRRFHSPLFVAVQDGALRVATPAGEAARG